MYAFKVSIRHIISYKQNIVPQDHFTFPWQTFCIWNICRRVQKPWYVCIIAERRLKINLIFILCYSYYYYYVIIMLLLLCILMLLLTHIEIGLNFLSIPKRVQLNHFWQLLNSIFVKFFSRDSVYSWMAETNESVFQTKSPKSSI